MEVDKSTIKRIVKTLEAIQLSIKILIEHLKNKFKV